MRFEADEITLLGGIRHGRTLGSPVAIEIANTEWPKWTEEMSPEPGRAVQGADPAPARATPTCPGCSSTASTTPGTCSSGPRPGRRRPGVAAGTLAKLLLTHLGVSIVSHIVALGDALHDPGEPAARARATWTGRRERRALLRPGDRGGDDRRRQGRRRRWVTRSAAWPRSWPTACRSASAATCTGIASSMRTWPRP